MTLPKQAPLAARVIASVTLLVAALLVFAIMVPPALRWHAAYAKCANAGYYREICIYVESGCTA